jgi:hypothetical protein
LDIAIADAEPKLAKMQARLAEQEARETARAEKVKAYERIPMNERQAYERGRVRSHAWRHNDGRPIPEIPGECTWREVCAYRAGLAGEPIPGLEVKTNGAGDHA